MFDNLGIYCNETRDNLFPTHFNHKPLGPILTNNQQFYDNL